VFRAFYFTNLVAQFLRHEKNSTSYYFNFLFYFCTDSCRILRRNGITGYALKTKLHDIISQKNINWHYDGIQLFYTQTDLDKYYDHDSSNTEYLLDIYSEIPTGPDSYEYIVSQLGGGSTEGSGYNKEHMMPQSTFTTIWYENNKKRTISDYPMFSDLNFIIPADARINQQEATILTV
jgi:hypothetical protein